MPGQDLNRVLLLVNDGQLFTLTFVPAGDSDLYRLVTSSLTFGQ